MKKRIFSLLLCLSLCLSLLPTGAFAEDSGTAWHGVNINLGDLQLQSCSSTVAYAGYEWVMIGNGQDEENGLHLGTENCITLFLKKTSIGQIGSPVLFREAKSQADYEALEPGEQAQLLLQYQEYTGTHINDSGHVNVTAYYAKNVLEGLKDWERPNEYAGSTVQQAVEVATYEIPEKERDYIVPRNFEGSDGDDLNGVSEDGIAGQGLTGQHLWLLSESEWDKLQNLTDIQEVLHSYSGDWWLRSPGLTETCKNACGFHAATISRFDGSKSVYKVSDWSNNGSYSRPALILRLPDANHILMLTQTGDPYASKPEDKEVGKDKAKTGGAFIQLTRPDTTKDRLKLTVQDDAQTLTLSAPKDLTIAEDGKLTLAYAFTHMSPKIDTQGKFYLSCMIRNDQGNLMGYARLAEPAQGVEGKGEVTIDLTQIQVAGIDLERGKTYSFLFFTEEVSGPLYTDFASAPVEVKVTVGDENNFTVDHGDVNTDATVENTSAEYNKDNPENPPTFSLDGGGNELKDVMRGKSSLQKDRDYTITDANPASAPTTARFPQTAQRAAGDTQLVTFTAEYLNSLSLGKHTFTFVMNCGVNPQVEIIISDTGSNNRPPTPSGEDGGGAGGGSAAPSTCTLTFETNGGSRIDNIRKIYGETVKLSGYTPTREGYEFNGWYSDKALTQRITEIKLSGSKTVYAGWTAIKPNPNTGAGNPFTDVKESDWFFDDVMFVYDKEIMVGTSDTTFSPGQTTSRAMIATILWRQAGSPVVNYAMNFSDVDPSAWYGEAVRWAASEGIVSGYGEGKFGPNDAITREQLATMLYNYEKKQGGGFTGAWAFRLDYEDAGQVSEWAYEPMSWCVMNDVISGTSSTTLSPQGQATRAQAAAMLHRFMN